MSLLFGHQTRQSRASKANMDNSNRQSTINITRITDLCYQRHCSFKQLDILLVCFGLFQILFF